MSDHIIIADIADITEELPTSAEGFDNTYWIAWTKPDSEDTVKVDTSFTVKFNRPIDLTTFDNTNFELQKIIELSPLVTETVSDPFETIDTTQDYNSITRELTLTLIADLDVSSSYFFIIKDLVDTIGEIQVEDHIVVFATSLEETQYDATTEDFDIDEIIVEDYTLIAPPLPADAISSRSLVTSSIEDGTLSVDSSTQTITLSYAALVTTSNISVTKENLDTGVTSTVAATITQNSTTFLVTITLPNVGTVAAPIYVEGNCIYSIDAIYTIIQFVGVLDPYYVSINSFLPYTSAAQGDPILWARIIFMYSKEVEAMMGDNATTLLASKPEAVTNYTKYFILSMFNGTSSNDSFMLGELQVTTGQSSGGLSAGNYASLLKDWENILFGYGSQPMSFDPYYPRPGRFPHDDNRSAFDREWTTFDRRLD